MEGYEAATYGDRIAEVYDQWYGGGDDDGCVERLAELAGAGPALELGIGTGRIAIPLAGRGVEVHGIDASAAMVERLRAKPGGQAIPVTVADFADLGGVGGSYTLVYAVFNTFFALLTQDDQVRCMTGAAQRLRPGGAFVVEVFVPDVRRFDRDQNLTVRHLGLEEARLDLTRHDPVAQRIDFHNIVLGPGGIRMQPGALRYAWPAELDVMARLAGLRLRERRAGWRREPFTAEARGHVSVYQRA
jgi:SAM-dependent methyltransferase